LKDALHGATRVAGARWVDVVTDSGERREDEQKEDSECDYLRGLRAADFPSLRALETAIDEESEGDQNQDDRRGRQKGGQRVLGNECTRSPLVEGCHHGGEEAALEILRRSSTWP